MPDLNILAAAVTAVAAFVASSVYYGVLAAAGHPVVTTGDGAARPPAWKVAVELVRSLVVALAVAGLVTAVGASWGGAIGLALLLWAAFPAVLLAGSVIWENVPVRIAAGHAGDWLLKLLLIAAIAGAWR
jgi:Protein of unknown function (DUF1761)